MFCSGPVSVVYPFAEPTVGNEIRQRNFGHLNATQTHEQVLTVDDNGKIRKTFDSPSAPLEYQGVLKQTPGMRTMKSLSGT